MGALSQTRILGGTLGLAVRCVTKIRVIKEALTIHSTTVLNSHISNTLKATIEPETLQAIADSFSVIDSLSLKDQKTVRLAFSEGFNKQNILLAVFSGAALICSLFLWEKSPRRVEKG